MVILEGESMTQAYDVNTKYYPDPLLEVLLSKPQLYYIFYDKDVHHFRISNTSVHQLLGKMNENICEVIENHLYLMKPTRSSSTRSTIYKTSKTRKYREYRKYRKTRKAEDDGSDDEDTTRAQGRKKKTKKRKSKKFKKYNKFKK